MFRHSKLKKAQEEGDWPSIVEFSHDYETEAVLPNHSLKVLSIYGQNKRNLVVYPIDKNSFVHIASGRVIEDKNLTLKNYGVMSLLEVCEFDTLKKLSLSEIRKIEHNLNTAMQTELCL